MAKITSSIPLQGGVKIHNNLQGLNDGDYIHLTELEKNKFDNLPNTFAPVDAEKNVNTDWNAISGDEQLLNKPSTFPPSTHTHVEADITDLDKYTQNEVNNLLNDKVDKIPGKGLSTEDYTTTEKTKLSGIEAGAEVNNISDTNVTDLTDGGETTLHNHDSRYYTETEINNLLNDKFDNPTGNNTQYLNGTGTPTIFPTIPSISGLATESYVDLKIEDVIVDGVTNKAPSQNAVNDALALKADLVGGLIPSSQLPAFIDDVLEFANLAAFPTTGEIGKIYIAISPKNLQYRWSGSSYIAITNGLIASTNDVPEGTNLYFTVARVLAALLDASDSTKGVSKLYNALGSNTDGSINQKIISDNFALKFKSADICVKSLNTDISMNTNVQLNTNLTFPIGVNENWVIEFVMSGGCTSSGGTRFQINTPAGSIGSGHVTTSGTPAAQGISVNSPAVAVAASSASQPVRIFMTIRNGATAGNVTLSFASNSNGQTSILRANSYFIATKTTLV